MDNGIDKELLNGQEGNTLKDYIRLIRNNWLPVFLITVTGLVVAIIYASNAIDIYKATSTLKITKQTGDVLTSPLMPEFTDWGNDRFIANEIEIMKSYSTREKVAKALIDSFYRNPIPKKYNILLDDSQDGSGKTKLPKSISSIVNAISNISIDQKRGLDIVEVTAESPSPYEAALIANTYAKEYKVFNLNMNRNQLQMVKDFLKEQRVEKQQELNEAEETLRHFQEKGNVIALDEQASKLIEQLADFDAQENAAKVDLMTSEKVLSNLKQQLSEQDPKMADYLKSLSSQTYIEALQDEIVKLEINKEIALAKQTHANKDEAAIKEYDNKIIELKDELNKQLEVLKAGIFASSPEEVKELSQKIIEEEIKRQSLEIRVKEIEQIVNRYEKSFNRLPKTSIELARYQRRMEALEKLYLLVEQRYQEALINEQSQPGNVLVIDKARIPKSPAKPNRILIVLVGFVLGMGLALGYVFMRNYFDDTIKTPEDIQNKNVNVLAWIPKIEGIGTNGKTSEFQFIVAKSPDALPSEAFRALRTRIQFSRIAKDSLKTILVTSAAPQEGKTTMSVNLAGSFALTNKRTLLLDCDLRKPRVHSIFKTPRVPGLIDFLFGDVKLGEIIKQTELENLQYITTGTLPPNPAEMLDSDQMRNLLSKLRDVYDLILLDSPPIIAVTDSEILSGMVDGTVLVVSAETTEIDLMERAVELIKREDTQFLGTILNNFSYKSGYGSYYKYYYYYSSPEKKKSS